MSEIKFVSQYTKEQLQGYLLACCDAVDELIGSGKLQENDLAKCFADKVREYITITTHKADTRPVYYYNNSNDLISLGHYCSSCGEYIGPFDIHICWQPQSSNTGTNE